MIITPVFTEKSLKLAKQGKYTFKVGRTATKAAVKTEIAGLFKVHVTGIKTISVHGEAKRNAKGKKYRTNDGKKAMVTLKEGEKINIFEESKKQ